MHVFDRLPVQIPCLKIWHPIRPVGLGNLNLVNRALVYLAAENL
jgi:hypothetical protein